jgi:hypothetical protein
MLRIEKDVKPVVEVPRDYPEPILEVPHEVVKGENVVTCRLDIREPLKQVDQNVGCAGCGTIFGVVLAKG